MRQNLFTYLGDTPPPTHDCPVFLPGWGFDGQVTTLAAPPRPWLTPNRPAAPAEILAALDESLTQQGIESIALTGWSLGAYLALDFAAAHPEKISAIYLLAGRDHWPPAEIAAIRQGITADQNGFMRSFYRKCFLGYRQAGQAFREKLEEAVSGRPLPSNPERRAGLPERHPPGRTAAPSGGARPADLPAGGGQGHHRPTR